VAGVLHALSVGDRRHVRAVQRTRFRQQATPFRGIHQPLLLASSQDLYARIDAARQRLILEHEIRGTSGARRAFAQKVAPARAQGRARLGMRDGGYRETEELFVRYP